MPFTENLASFFRPGNGLGAETIQIGGADVNGIWNEDHTGAGEVEGALITFWCALASLPGGVAAGTPVVRNATNYTVAAPPESDEAGGAGDTTLILHKV